MDKISEEALKEIWESIKDIEINYSIVDGVCVSNDIELKFWKSRLEILRDYVSYFILVDIRESDDDPIPEDMKDRVFRIILKKEDIESPIEPYSVIDYVLEVMLDEGKILMDDLVLIGSPHEVPNAIALLSAKSYYPKYSQPITLNMLYCEGFVNRLKDYQVAGSVLASVGIVTKEGTVNTLINRNLYAAIDNAGYRFDLDSFTPDSKAKKLGYEYLPEFIKKDYSDYLYE